MMNMKGFLSLLFHGFIFVIKTFFAILKFLWPYAIELVSKFARFVYQHCTRLLQNVINPDVPSNNIHRGTCCRKLIQDIENLAFVELETPHSYTQEGRAISHEIFKELQKNEFGIVIDRFRIAGSVGKGTCISYVNKKGRQVNPDFDIVPYINDMKPPFKDVLDVLEVIIRRMPRTRNFHTTSIAVQFDYESEGYGKIKFDLVPAGNYVRQPTHRQDIAEVEALETEDRIQEEADFSNDGIVTREICRLHSTGFCEKGIDIIKSYVDGDSMMLGVIRLAKYWTSQINFEGIYISARSYIIEIIAIECQRGKKRRCLISCFRRFLEAMSDLGQLKITHIAEDDPEIQETFRYTPLPIICNIANPKDNLAHGMDPKVIRIFEEQATETLALLDRIKGKHEYEQAGDAMSKIFCHKDSNWKQAILPAIIIIALVYMILNYNLNNADLIVAEEMRSSNMTCVSMNATCK